MLSTPSPPPPAQRAQLYSPSRIPSLRESLDDSDVELPSRPASPASSASINSLFDVREEPVQVDNDDEPSDAAGTAEAAEVGGRPLKQRKVRDYMTRQAHRRDAQNAEVDLTDLWDDELYKLRDHEPPPEADYPTYDAAIDAINDWGKSHGVAYKKSKWAKGKRYRKRILCSSEGQRRETSTTGDKRKRAGAESIRTGCPMALWVVANDCSNLESSTWRVLHYKDRKSVQHNHPPQQNPYVFPRYRRETRKNLDENAKQQLSVIFEGARGTKQALLSLQKAFPDVYWTRQDVKNEYQRYQREKLGMRTKVELLIAEMDEAGWWHE